MAKGTHYRFRFLAQGKKKRLVLTTFCLLAVCLVLSLTALYGRQNGSQIQGSEAASSFSAHAAGVTAYPSGTGQTQQSQAAPSSADVTVDFGSRQNKAHPIPSSLLGVGGIGIGYALNHDGSAVPQANFRLTKLGDFDYMSQVFPTPASATDASQQNWTQFDMQMALVVSYHLQTIITLAYTPAWLQPQNQQPPLSNPCLTYNPPIVPFMVRPVYMVNGQDRGPQVWGQLAAQFVAHVDHKFPQAHAMFEIWNQPDGSNFLCEPNGDPNAPQDRLNDYKAIFAAAAPQMKKQASNDAVQIKIGGPALTYALQKALTLWFPGLLNDPTIYPYIDFISYHRFLRGTSFNAGDTSSFVANAQDPTLGVEAEYEQVAKYVHAGKQPSAATTPIYIDEYNMDSCKPAQCKNDPTYAPLTNALFLVDVLNTVNDRKSVYGAAPYLPAGLTFYTWNIKLQSICMFGVIDANLDCAVQNGTIQPYPQYYSYELLGGASYLNMTDGAYVANAASANPASMYVTGFYTNSLDNVVIVNASSTARRALHVLAQNPGNLSGLNAKLYLVHFDRSDPGNSISTQQVNLVRGTQGFFATVDVPALTVVALSFTAS